MVNQKAQLAGLVQLLAEEQHLSSTEIAETLWLALRIEPAVVSDSAGQQANEPADEWLDIDDSLPEPVVADTSDLGTDEPEPDELDEPDEPESALSPSSPRANVTTAGSEATALPVAALPVWIADLPMLRDPLALMRSLKPLLQQVEVGVGTEIDEPATVERIAQTQLWLPVLKPETEPWFDVVLVVDSSSSMHLWRQLAVDLEQIFRRYGAFRNLQVYDLVVSDAAEDAVRLVTHADRPGHHPGELIEQRGRRIAIVLSDCAAPYWWDGRLLPMLQGWAKAMPMVVWQMLPEWMWERTALGRGQMVSLSNGKPGAANQRLQPLPVGMETIDEADGRSAVPIITSATADLKNWGLMLSGDRRERTPGFLLPQAGGRVPKAKSLEEIARGRVGDDEDEITAEIGKIAQTRIDRFLRFASPAACQLVMLLAAAPVITLPVMRLVRESMMSEEKDEARSPLPVAEVFLSGLLQRLPEQGETVKGAGGEMRSLDKSQVQYTFIPQSRQLLLKVMPPVETVAVVNRVSAMVEDRWNSFSNKSFKAFLTDPSVEVPPELAGIRSFASITAEILKPLGGQYANFAEKLLQGETASPQVSVEAEDPIFAWDVKKRAIEIEVEFKANIQRSSLSPMPPIFTLPAEIADLPFSDKRTRMKTAWESIQAEYEYATRTGERSRLNQLIDSSRKFINEYPELTLARYNLGCAYLKLERLNESRETLKSVAAISLTPAAFHNWAVAVLRKGDEAEAFHALEEFLVQVSLSSYLDDWYVYLGFVVQFQTLEGLVRLYERAAEESREDIQQLLNGTVYLLKSRGLTADAYQLISEMSHPAAGLSAESFKQILDKLGFHPSKVFLQEKQHVAEEILGIAETSKRRKEEEKDSIKMLLTYASRWAQNKRYAQAIGELNKVLDIDPEHPLANKRRDEYRAELRKQAVPSGPGPFARGRHAKDVEEDLKKAEILFREAIREGDRFESAVKDLAQVYQQQGQVEKAIDLLLTHRNEMKRKEPVDSLLAHMYVHSGKYSEAIDRLKIVLDNIPNNQQNYVRIHNVLTQISYCYYRLKDYDEAESILEQALEFNPEGETAKSRLAALQEARISGVYGEADKYFLEIDTQSFVEITLSEFLLHHLKACDYAGVEASKVATKNFSEEDVQRLVELASQLGTHSPRARASYYLSAAKILVDKGQRPEEHRPSLFLRNFCAAMGDACISEQKDRDVARSYYSEAFLIAPRWAAQLNVKLTQFIMLYYVDAPSELLEEELPYADAALETAFNLPSEKIHTQVMQGLLNLSRLNNGILRHLSERIYPKPKLRYRIQEICYDLLEASGESVNELLETSGKPVDSEAEFLSLWEKGQCLMQQLDQKVKEDIALLQSFSSYWDTLEANKKKVKELERRMLQELDRKRLSQVRQVLGLVSDYSRQRAYAEQEYTATRIESVISQYVESIERNPTKYSVELFRPYLKLLGQNIKSRFNEIQRVAEPETLKIELAIETYPNQSNIDCQIAVSNSPGKSPASAIEIVIKDSPDGDYVPLQRAIPVKEFLPGGTQSTCIVPLSITEKAMQAKTFTLYYMLSYSTRRETEPIEIEGALSLPLYSAEDFEEIHNPYAAYANGIAVTNEAMFYGRDQVIERIVRDARNTTASTHFVLYGQKRVGKSSLLYHVKERMVFPLIPVSFTLGVSAANLTMASFLFQILQNMQRTFGALEDSGMPRIAVSMPSIEAIERNPDRQFDMYMRQLQRFFNQSETYREARIVLLIDEFSYLYSAIQTGEVPYTFMKFWKALAEQDYFSIVVVGHSNMRKFIDDFPNEFQGSTIKLPYLDSDSARKLIEDPIRIPDSRQSRYRGSAVEKLLELTAGSPYYIHIVCDQLVNYMNRKHVQYMTDADIAVVEREYLLQGNQRLSRHQFDNLFSAGDNVADGIASEDVDKVLREIAGKSAGYGYCDRSSINVKTTSASVEAILTDLCNRDVLEKRGRSQFKIRVKLFKDWLLIN